MQPPNLRPFDVSRDLNSVADLIEMSFSTTLDSDGYRYLHQMRAAAQNASFMRWANRVAERVSLPLSGFVWEEDGDIVGNLSLIPFQSWRSRTILIANVAVHPGYRQRGIARSLTRAALNHLQRKGAQLPWLQVRADNPAAIHLYQSLGFEEVARRTTWHNQPGQATEIPQTVTIGRRKSGHWEDQRRWFNSLHALELSWHFPLQVDQLAPGLRGAVRRLVNSIYVRQWSASQGTDLIGVLTWQSTGSFVDTLWLSVNPQKENLAIQSLLAFAKKKFGSHRSLSFDYPAGQASATIETAGFHVRQTLIWMRAARWE